MVSKASIGTLVIFSVLICFALVPFIYFLSYVFASLLNATTVVYPNGTTTTMTVGNYTANIAVVNNSGAFHDVEVKAIQVGQVYSNLVFVVPIALSLVAASIVMLGYRMGWLGGGEG